LASGLAVRLVIVTYDSGRHVPTLAGWLGRLEPSVDVVVVDNSSSDDTVVETTLALPSATVIVMDRNVGFGAAANRGAEGSESDVLIFLNPDVMPIEPWLERLVTTFEGSPDIGIAFPQTPYPGSVPATPRGVVDQATGPGAAMAVRASAFRDLGGFDETIFLYWEDTDLSWRGWLKGWRVVVDDRAVVFHERGGSGGGSAWAVEQARNGAYVVWSTLPSRTAFRVWAGIVVRSSLRSVRRHSPTLALAPFRPTNGWSRVRSRRQLLAESRRRHGRTLSRLVVEHRRDQARRWLRRLRSPAVRLDSLDRSPPQAR
jgi:N-acetylglucosaminyl-diphospho-decaprenol L-rhamnosyltransferase